jgi:hypothetical protein
MEAKRTDRKHLLTATVHRMQLPYECIKFAIHKVAGKAAGLGMLTVFDDN